MLNQIKTFFREHLLADKEETAVAKQHRLELAVAALLLEMTRMDGAPADSGQQEQCARVEAAIGEHFSLDGEEIQKLIDLAEAEREAATDYFQFTSLINASYRAEQKQQIIEQLWTVALADQELHRHEEHLVRKIAQLLHVPHQAFIAAKHRASGQL